jgi:parallel beta-helix repeat protein
VIEFEAGSTIKYSSSGKVFSGKGVNNVMIINPVISRSNAEDVLYFANSDTIIIQGGKITGTKGQNSAGFECKSCKNVLFQGVTVSTFSRPIDVGTTTSTTDGSTRNVWIVGNTISNSSVECAKINRGYDMHAIGNNVKDCTNNGIDLGYNVGAEARNNTLTNTGYGSLDNAVGFHTDSATLIVIVGNRIDITGTDGIRICGSDNNYVVNNEISHTGDNTDHPSGNGISVISCTGGTLTVEKAILDGNSIHDTRKTGIYITASATQIFITNNTIDNFGTGSITDASKKATISGNTIT